MARANNIRLTQIALALLACAGLLLSGCGGNDGSPDTSATPSSETPATPARPVSNNTSSSLLFASLNLVDATGAPSGQQLVLVDPATGSAVNAINVDEQSMHLSAQAFTMSADGLSTQAGDDKKLYYTNGGKLFEVGLTKPATPGAGRQVSSEAHVCAIAKVLPKDATANASWIVLNTAGPDGACEYTDDNEVKVVSSEFPDSVGAVNVSTVGQSMQILDVQRDGQGNLIRLIGYLADVVEAAAPASDPASSATATTFKKLSIIAITADAPPVTVAEIKADAGGSLPSVTSFGKVAGSSTQVYLQIGQDIRLLSWNGGTPILASTPVATLASGTASFVRTDGQATYFVDGEQVKAIPSVKAQALFTLADGEEVQPGSAMSATTLALIVRNRDTYAMHVVDKISGTDRTVDFGARTALKVEAVNGDILVVSQAAAVDSGVTLWRVDAAGGSGTTITPTKIAGTGHAQVVTVVHGDNTTLSGESTATHVVWCDAAKAACNPQNLSSYQVASGTNLLLSPANIVDTPTWANAVAGSRSTTLGLMTSSASPYELQKDGSLLPVPLVSDSIWLFDAASTGSLTRITVPAAAQ
jgi:hypothetical protein